jgi:rod shape determining protein RodA
MTRRSWRNFDFVLAGVLLLLAAYGVVMIYSATINTLGIENAVQRQIAYVIAGTAILAVVASLDYHLLDMIQHPISVLKPLVLGLIGIGLIITLHMEQISPADSVLSIETFAADLPAAMSGLLAVSVVYLVDRTWLQKVDLPLARLGLAALLLAAIAVAAFVASRSLSAGGPPANAVPYLVGLVLASVYLLDCLTLRFTDTLANPLYVLMLATLVVLFVIGQVSGGAQRWLGAGTVQPSELTKILLIVVLAKYLTDHEESLNRFATVLTSLGIVVVPMALIYLQPDLGTALTLAAIWAAMMWIAGIRLRHLLLLVGAVVAVLPLAWLNLESYMQQRITLFINPSSDPDSYFNVHQALVSIGSGGWAGKGLTQGSQSQLHFLRVRHTDFIFAVTAEELGFLGAAAMIALIFFLLWRIVRVAERARDPFGRLIAAGVGGLILFQSSINIGMNLGLMPVTGIPLPFVSYGGSSFLTLMLGLGLVESVAMRRKKLEFD